MQTEVKLASAIHAVAKLVLAAMFPLAVAAALGSCQTNAGTSRTAPSPASSVRPTATAPTKEWILVDLPADATQLQYGAEVYRLVCSACHGDHGQGLTDAWRATWAPKDQNCWQSKCHGANHPPDGFELPIAPAIAGAGTLTDFSDAQALHDFIQSEMPWQNPNSLTEKDSWSATAYVLKLNGIDPGLSLSSTTASGIRLGE